MKPWSLRPILRTQNCNHLEHGRNSYEKGVAFDPPLAHHLSWSWSMGGLLLEHHPTSEQSFTAGDPNGSITAPCLLKEIISNVALSERLRLTEEHAHLGVSIPAKSSGKKQRRESRMGGKDEANVGHVRHGSAGWFREIQRPPWSGREA
eukprot:4534802-Amphidinium_carterae.1